MVVEVEAMRPALVHDFAGSELFERTFREGMALVEDAAAYLDGAGRQDSKALARDAALLYAGESMKLTTRLMQVASWLLVQRAVREGDMSADAAAEPRYRIVEDDPHAHPPIAGPDLPAGLVILIERAERLYGRALHLDRRMYLDEEASPAANTVLNQLQRLEAAFGG